MMYVCTKLKKIKIKVFVFCIKQATYKLVQVLTTYTYTKLHVGYN